MDYIALKTEIALPAYNGMTDAQTAVAVSAKTVPAAQKALLNPTDIINAIVPADLLACTQVQLLAIVASLSGSQVDASPGTTIRALFLLIFSGKATTLGALAALVAPYDNATVGWTALNLGVPSVSVLDVAAARLR